MFNKKNKVKGSPVNKTKEELLADLKKNGEFIEKMKFTKEVFYPALCKATNNIEDAIQNLSIINTVILEKFLAKMKEIKMKDIDIYSNLSEKDPQYENLKAMLNLFDDKNVFEAKELFEGMKSEISLFLNEEQKNRKLDELATKWIDEM
jgi:hypothetical protein